MLAWTKTQNGWRLDLEGVGSGLPRLELHQTEGTVDHLRAGAELQPSAYRRGLER